VDELERLLAQLLERRSRVRELILSFKDSSRNPFPNWRDVPSVAAATSLRPRGQWLVISVSPTTRPEIEFTAPTAPFGPVYESATTRSCGLPNP